MSQTKSSGMFGNVWKIVGYVLGFTSLLNYYNIFANQGIYPVFEALVSNYRAAVHLVFGFLDAPLEAAARFIAGLFQIHVDVQPYWKDVFVPIGLYFASSARATHGEGRAMYRNALYFLGVVIALVSSLFLASLGELSLAPALATLTAGVVVYELLSYVLLLLLVNAADRQSSPGFWRYVLERPLPSVALGVLATIVATFSFADNENAAAFALIVFILLLGLRSMALAVMFAAENRGGWPGTFRDRLNRSRSWALGVGVVVAIVAATLCVAWGG